MSVPNVLAKALYDNVAESPDELSFRKGDIMTVLERDTQGLDGWWLCSLHGRQGIVPGNRLKILVGMYDGKQQTQPGTQPSSTTCSQSRPAAPLYSKPPVSASSAPGIPSKPLASSQYTSMHPASYSTAGLQNNNNNPDSVYMMPPSHAPKSGPQSVYQVPPGPVGPPPPKSYHPAGPPALAQKQYHLQQPQQQILLQQQMQPGGVQAPVIQQVRPITQVLAPMQGGLSQQTGVIIQPQQLVLAPGNKVQGNAQVMQAAAMAAQPGQTAAQLQQQLQQAQQAQGAAAPQAPQQPQAQQQQQPPMMLQVDGAGDTSSEEDEDEEEEYDEDEEEEKDKDGGEDGQVEEEPLNSEDDVTSEEEDQELFDTENVVVCQYDKIHRSKNKWKFHLKDGIMNLNGRDYVFSKAIGDAEW